MTEDELDGIADVIVVSVKTALRRALAPLKDRLATLETRPAVSAFDGSKNYLAGSLCTCRDSVWLARIDSTGVEPGDAPAVWQLVAKRGTAE